MPVGVAAIGYGDGYRAARRPVRRCWSTACACPLVGRASMDLVTTDLRAAPRARRHRVTLWGRHCRWRNRRQRRHHQLRPDLRHDQARAVRRRQRRHRRRLSVAKAGTATFAPSAVRNTAKWQGSAPSAGSGTPLRNSRCSRPAARSAPSGGYAGAAAAGRAAVTPLAEVAPDGGGAHHGRHRWVRSRAGRRSGRWLGGAGGRHPGIGKSTLLLQTTGGAGRAPAGPVRDGRGSHGPGGPRAQRLGLPLMRAARTGGNLHRAHSGAGRRGTPRVLVNGLHPDDLDRTADRGAGLGRRCESPRPSSRAMPGERHQRVPGRPRQGRASPARACSSMVDAVLYFEGESGSRFRIAAPSRTASVRSTSWACSPWATRACVKCPIRAQFSCPRTAGRRRAVR